LEVRAQFHMDKSYFRESYSQWLRNFSRFRRWERRIGAVLIFVGLASAHYSVPPLVSAAIVTLGFAEILEFYWYRHNWISGRMEARESGTTSNAVELAFSETGVRHRGPTAHGEFSWHAVKKIDFLRQGLFLRIGDGHSIYVPAASLTPSDATEMIAKWSGYGT